MDERRGQVENKRERARKLKGGTKPIHLLCNHFLLGKVGGRREEGNDQRIVGGR